MFSYDQYGSYGRPSPLRGEVAAVVSFNDSNRDTLTKLAKHHFAKADIVGINDDGIELRVVPRPAVQSLINSKGGTGTFQVIEGGREASSNIRRFVNDVVAKQRADAVQERGGQKVRGDSETYEGSDNYPLGRHRRPFSYRFEI